jgi:hypothetical protein
MTRTLVFLGPSLPISKARTVLPEASYLPPIRRGDLTAALKEHPAVVGIVDGQFLQSLAVSPLEIFAALRAGTIVLDPTFRQMFKADREKTLARYQLTPKERSGLAQFDVQALELAVRNLQMSRSVPTESWFW